MNPNVPAVSFEATIEELADVQIRYANLTSVGKQMRRQYARGLGIAVGLTFAIATAAEFGWSDASAWVTSGAVGLLIGSLVAGYGRLSYDDRLRRRQTQLLKSAFGPEPFRCDVELTPEGVVTRQKNTVTTNPWKDLTAVNELPEGVELCFQGGYVMVRARAFGSPAERAYFLDSITHWRNERGLAAPAR